MSRRSASRLAWSLWATVLALLIAAGVMGGLAEMTDGESIATFAVAGAVFLVFASVGAVVASRRPDNPIGWLFLAVPALMMVANATGTYIELAVDRSLPGAVPVAVASSWTWPVGLCLILVVLVLFPDGRLPSPRWRPVAASAVALMALTVVVFVFRPGRFEYDGLPGTNPVGVRGLDTVGDIALVVGLVALSIAALISLALRFDKNREQREQIKWLLAAFVLVIVVLTGSEIVNGLSTTYNGMPDAVFLAVIGTIPVATAVAILKYRLYEIDRIVNRAVVYGLATVGLAALYFGIVLALQQVFGGLARGNDLAIAGSTLAVAALFRPARRWIQGFVDRRFYRSRYDAEQTLRAFGARLRDEVDLDTLGADLGDVVHETLQPTHVSLWLRYSKARL